MFYIAEIGLNHNGSLKLARQMVRAAQEAGADAVKFQSIQAEKLIARHTFENPVDGFGFSKVKTVGDFWRKVSIDERFHREIKKLCDNIGIEFMSTPFDRESVEWLEEIGVKRFKIASGDLTNYPLIEHILTKNKPVILSTGGAKIDEIQSSINFIRDKTPNIDLSVLHCVSLYPTPPALANLQAIDQLQLLHSGPIGFSDHTLGFHLALGAIARGAEIIEKHFTIDQKLPGPDQSISATPPIFSKIVKLGNDINKALQADGKQLSSQEKDELNDMRRSIVAAKDMNSGTILTSNDLEYKRPGDGISPIEFKNVIGKQLKTDIAKDEQIKWSLLDD
ncbi:MAG: N-acetylneuraminate synthase family protein [Candidatus Marinimicrobia bacterium]|nr:N-acetylneuraminate synthase family protein [Candidatus Neomarinimicrobiota bacterium]